MTKKTYTVSQIREALAYWKGRMAQLDEGASKAEVYAAFKKLGITSADEVKARLKELRNETDKHTSEAALVGHFDKYSETEEGKAAIEAASKDKGGDKGKGGDKPAVSADAAQGVKKAEQAADSAVPPTEKAEQAAPEVDGEWNVSARLYRIHLNAQKKARTAVQMSIQKYFKIAPDDIIVSNSYVNPAKSVFSLDTDKPMVITLKVKASEANVKGLRKVMAGLLKESGGYDSIEAGYIAEGAFGQFFKGIGKGIAKLGKGVKDWSKATKDEVQASYRKGVEKANGELKDKIGVTGIQRYVKLLCGGSLDQQITGVAMGQEDKGNTQYLTWSVKIRVEI